MNHRRNTRTCNAISWQRTGGLARGKPLRWRNKFATLLGLFFSSDGWHPLSGSKFCTCADPPQDQHLIIQGVCEVRQRAYSRRHRYCRHSATAQTFVTWTEVDGSYVLQVPVAGRYVVHTDMAAFVPCLK
jgi:hypothetical protein